MATKDLGTIEQERAPSTQRGAHDVGRTLTELGGIAGQMVQDHVTGGATEDLNTVVDQAIAADRAVTAQPLDEEAIPFEKDSPEWVVLDEVRRLRTSAEGAGSNLRGRIELEMRTVISDASDKHPGMKNLLRSEFGRFVATDPELAAMALRDERADAAIAIAQADTAALKDYAYDDLGLSRTAHRYGTKEFAIEYVKREEHHQARIVNEQLLASQESEQDLSIDTHLVTFNAKLQGKASDIREAYNTMHEGLKNVQKAMRDPTAGGSLELKNMWENGGRDQALREVAMLRYEMASVLNTMPVRYRDNAKFASAKIQYDENMAAVDTLITAIQTNDPSLVEVWNGYTTAKLIQFERENPVIAQQLRILNEMAPGLEAASETFDDTGARLNHFVGKILEGGLSTLIGQDLGMSQIDGLPVGASVEGITSQWSVVRVQNQDLYNTGDTTPEGIQAATAQSSLLTSKPEYLDLALDEAVAPVAAAAMFSAEGMRANIYLTTGTFRSDGAKEMLQVWKDPANFDLAKKSNRSDQPNMVEATMQQVGLMMNRYNDTREKQLESLLGQNIGASEPLSLGQAIKSIDASKLESDGKVSFVLDRAKVLATAPMASRGLKGQPEQHFRRAQVKANELAAEINLQLAWISNIQATWDQTFIPDYVGTWESSMRAKVGDIENGEAQ